MTDEKYLFIQDVRDKKRTARSSHNRRTHAGKSGGVKLPSDYLTKKEREKMNGEPTTYRITSPMAWAEFKAMPDDLKVMYINWIREEFQAPDSAVADMFGVHGAHLCRTLRAVGIGPTGRAPNAKWDKKRFAAFAGITEKAEAEPEMASKDEPSKPVEEVKKSRGLPELEYDDELRKLAEEAKKAPILPVMREQVAPATELIPTAGWMNFEGPADQALRAIGNVLGSACVRLYVSWNPINTEDTQDGGC